MGRRSEHSREELEELIIKATLALVKEQGSAAVTARQIAQSVGYTPGMLYSIFDNLQDIYLHVNVVSLDELHQQCVNAQKKAKSPEAAILAMGKAYLKFATNNTHQYLLLFSPMPLPNNKQPAELNKRIRSLFELIEKELMLINDSNEQHEVKMGARVLWSGVHGATALSLTDQLYSEAKNPAQSIINLLVERFLRSW